MTPKIRGLNRQICLAWMFCNRNEQKGGLLVIVQHLVMFVCVACQTGSCGTGSRTR